MNRLTKINKIRDLKETIDKQKQIIKLETERLHSLEIEEERVALVELPILLFTLKDVKEDNIYVYYYADLNKVDFVSNDKEFIHNAIDLRSKLTNINMPTMINQENTIECSEKIDIVIATINAKIDELFEKYNIKSWQELGIYLQSLKEEEFNVEPSLYDKKQKSK